MQSIGLNAVELRNILLSRGALLNPPATSKMLATLARWAGGALDPDLVAVSNCFDGFVSGDYDRETFVAIRSIKAALADSASRTPMLAFADWSIDAIIYGYDPRGGPVTDLETGQVVASTYAKFWEQLLDNRL